MKINSSLLLLLLILPVFQSFSQVKKFPSEIDYKVQPYYRNRPDGQPGRAVLLEFKGSKLSLPAKLEINFSKLKETLIMQGSTNETDNYTFLLPPDVGVKKDASVNISIIQGKNKLEKTLIVPAFRHWTVYVYPHSHVDIGYSNTQENVEFIHKRNIDQGIKLAEKTKDYPEGSRYLWNTEVMWPIERYWQKATPEKKQELITAVSKGILTPDAAYVHVNTSTCSEEELLQLFKFSHEIEKLSGKPNDVMVQVDLPGMAWGIVPAMVQQGVKYIMMMPNGTRGNQKMTYALNQHPFWWLGPDGKSKVLFFQPGGYGVGLGKGQTTGRPWFGEQDTSRIPLYIKTDHPRANFLDDHLFKTLPDLEKVHHPLDIYVVTWALWDNALIDADLPDAVSSWNKEYAYPHLEIASAHQIMKTIEEKYGNSIPTVTGDYTEYWTDNMGVAARQTKMNNSTKERLVQAETIWTLLHLTKPFPEAEFDEAWRNVILGSEHTYAAENSRDPYFYNAVWKVKQSYFRDAEDQSIRLLDKALAPATDRSSGALGPQEGPSNGGIAVINTHSWNHNGLVILNALESQIGDKVIDDKNTEILSQRLTTGELAFMATDVPAFGSKHYRVVKGKCTITGTCKSNNNTLENGMLKVELDQRTGDVTHLTDMASGRDYADIKKRGGINTFRWQPAKGLGEAKSDSCIITVVKEAGPLIVEIVVYSVAPGCRSV